MHLMRKHPPEPMHAVILAAGVGQRLGKAAADRPKSLLRFGDQSLLARHLHNLRRHGITRITVVTGYQAVLIEQEIELHAAGLKIDTRHNPDYHRGSVVSLHAARDILTGPEPVLLMDADVLYEESLIDRLMTTRFENCFLLDREFEPGEEPVKLCISQGRLIDFRKHIDKKLRFDLQGESVGFFRFSPSMAKKLAQRADHYLQQQKQDEPYEEIIRDELLVSPEAFGYEDITGTAWIEIDFPADVQRAEQQVLPRIIQPVN